MLLQVALLTTLPVFSLGHGGMSKPCTWHARQRQFCMNDDWQLAGCTGGQPGENCVFAFFTNNTNIPGAPTIPDHPKGAIGDSLMTYKHSCIGERFEGNVLCDWTRKNPWRAPGSAPVTTPCGIGGGNPNGCPEGAPPGACPGGGYSYGRDARELPGNLFPAEWQAGGEAEVAWGIQANHGGGYQYRLCRRPANRMDLTESCFQANPLDFVGDKQWLQYGPDEANRAEIPAVRTRNGTIPSGSQWTRNPIPACGNFGTGDCSDPQFPPPAIPSSFAGGARPVGFDGFDAQELKHWHVVDKVHVPDLEPGDYVLSWRWDCEQSAQVWSNCADVTIKEKATTSTTTTIAITTTTTTTAVATTTPVAVSANFQAFDGADRACRGANTGDNSARYFGLFKVGSLEECQQRCMAVLDCKGIEFKGSRCEVWTREVGATVPSSGRTCMRYLVSGAGSFVAVNGGSNRACRGSSEADTSASYYVLFPGTASIEACKNKCSSLALCVGIEYGPQGRCEIWTRSCGIGATASVTGYTCLRYTTAPEEVELQQEEATKVPIKRVKSFLRTRANIFLQHVAKTRTRAVQQHEDSEL